MGTDFSQRFRRRPLWGLHHPPRDDALARAIESILKRDVFAPAIVAIDIRDLDTGKMLFEKNATTNVKPASTMKLFTT